MPAEVRIRVDEGLFLKDPESTDLGRAILKEGIQLIDDLGYEYFTFKKLATKIGSTEASVYRYFSSKRQLLKYIVSWYWHWLEYLLSLRTAGLGSPKRKIETAIDVLIFVDSTYSAMTYLDTKLLRRVIVAESARVALTREQKPREDKLFAGYIGLATMLKVMIKDLNPNYPFPMEFALTILASVHRQIHHADFISKDIDSGRVIKDKDRSTLVNFLNHLVDSTLSDEFPVAAVG